MMTKQTKSDFLSWYKDNARDLPWRRTRDPYAIWVSETMLQQTTTQAVIPFFERFIARFPTLKSLASAQIEDVFEHWAGLGYYSRARNLHKASQTLAKKFPKTYQELIDLPGFGPYTARSVASLAFDQSVGVLDGNVIRVLSRYYNLKSEWWVTKEREQLQALADQCVKGTESRLMNQALMELGATICVPQNPICLLCPLHASCGARKKQTIHELPLKRPRREREIWVWQAQVFENKGRILLCRDPEMPFLKKHWSLPGQARKVKTSPKSFHFRHSVTHHDIFVTVRKESGTLSPTQVGTRALAETKWVPRSELSRHVPASLVRKALAVLDR